MKFFKKLAVAAVVATGLTGCVSSAEMNNEAARAYRSVVQDANDQNAVDNSSPTARRIHTIFNRMKPYADQENKTGVPFNWEIMVVRSNELNAWAMAGGKMMFYTGLVDQLGLSDAQIATVMGHEMAHALKEHSKSDKTMSTITGLAAAAASAALASKGISTNVMGYDAVAVVKDLGLDKPFSRSQETEADEVGLMLMARSGYNPEEAPKLWEKMKSASGGSGGVFAALTSTHPTDEGRQENLQRLMPEALALYNASSKVSDSAVSSGSSGKKGKKSKVRR